MKKRILTKWEKISNELKREVKSVYPQGFKHKLENVLKGKERYIQVLPFETIDTIYFIEIPFTTFKKNASDLDDEINDDVNYSTNNDDENDDINSHVLYLQDDVDSHTDMLD